MKNSVAAAVICLNALEGHVMNTLPHFLIWLLSSMRHIHVFTWMVLSVSRSISLFDLLETLARLVLIASYYIVQGLFGVKVDTVQQCNNHV